MTPGDLTIEKTPVGMQYVIPGAERIVKPKRKAFKAERTPAGVQLVIPGAEKISTSEYVARLVDRPLTPRRGQVGLCGTGLFGDNHYPQ